jgi:hypothetical protein
MGGGTNPFVSAIYISVLYNISLPIAVFYLGKLILSKRPAGYGGEDPSKKESIKHLRNVNISLGKKLVIGINPLIFSLGILAVGLIIGFSPIFLHGLNPSLEIPPNDPEAPFKLMDYVCPPCGESGKGADECGPNCLPENKMGPFGIGATLLSLVVTATLGVSIGLFFALRSKNVIKVREQTRALEDEFSSALFQLGNRLGDGLPAEIAFARVAENMHGTTSGEFFAIAERNMTKLGMGLEQSIFDSRVGALTIYPSRVIESSMKVLVESAKKGPRIAAQALLSMSRYIKQIHTVEERLKDLMGEVISSMKSQIKFLTPAIAGIVVGITAMISTILTKLSAQLTNLTSQGGAEQAGAMGDLLNIFGVGIPTFHFQIVVGIYIVQIAYILTILSNGIENGSDKLAERYELGKNMINSTLLYCILSGIVVVLFNLFASQILTNVAIGG